MGAPHVLFEASAQRVHPKSGSCARVRGLLWIFCLGTRCRWLRDAVDAVAERDPQVAAAGHWGKVAVLSAWHTRLSVAFQKNNAACILQAGRVRGSADLGGESGWEEDIDDFLREAVAAAGWSDFEA